MSYSRENMFYAEPCGLISKQNAVIFTNVLLITLWIVKLQP